MGQGEYTLSRGVPHQQYNHLRPKYTLTSHHHPPNSPNPHYPPLLRTRQSPPPHPIPHLIPPPPPQSPPSTSSICNYTAHAVMTVRLITITTLLTMVKIGSNSISSLH